MCMYGARLGLSYSLVFQNSKRWDRRSLIGWREETRNHHPIMAIWMTRRVIISPNIPTFQHIGMIRYLKIIVLWNFFSQWSGGTLFGFDSNLKLTSLISDILFLFHCRCISCHGVRFSWKTIHVSLIFNFLYAASIIYTWDARMLPNFCVRLQTNTRKIAHGIWA